MISSMARGSNQCAIAHKVYETARVLYPTQVKDKLHGEMVAVGLIAQLFYNGEPADTIEAFRASLRGNGLPDTLHDLGVPHTEKAPEAFYATILQTSVMDGTTAEEQAKFHQSLELIL